ncbi:response regulator [Myxococcota bacterium]|nr:response regulator [Myxococcota bacterium]MBU1534660.1 response regulator [Myxococcota bacterium]
MMKSLKVLLVDDDVDFLFQQRLNLEQLDCVVLEATSVKQALAMVEKDRPDVAIIDLMMDQMDDGFVLAHHMKKMRPGMPVIMTTAVTQVTGYQFTKSDVSDNGWIKADVILSKPVRFEQLKAEFQKLGL